MKGEYVKVVRGSGDVLDWELEFKEVAKGAPKVVTAFDKLLDGIKAAKPARKETEEVWYKLLSHITPEQWTYAITKICREVKEFYPGTNFVALVLSHIEADLNNRAVRAWAVLLKNFSSADLYKQAQFEDTIIHSCVRAMGGIDRIGEADRVSLDWLRREFIGNYKALSGKHDHPDFLRFNPCGRDKTIYIGNNSTQKVLPNKVYMEEIEERSGSQPVRIGLIMNKNKVKKETLRSLKKTLV